MGGHFQETTISEENVARMMPTSSPPRDQICFGGAISGTEGCDDTASPDFVAIVSNTQEVERRSAVSPTTSSTV